MILTEADLFDLTHKERPSAQARELERLGIAHRTRSDGTLIVLWDDVRASTEAAFKRREPQLRLA